MKLFLKPTAIFACAVLLFCGCADDDTEDLSFTLAPISLDEPYDISVASGDGRAEFTWRVPEDSNITHAMVQWDNATGDEDATLNEITRVTVIPGQRKTFSIGEIGANELSAGDYNFYVTNITVNSSSVITARSNTKQIEKYIYDETTYADSRPNPYNIKTLNQKDVEIYWSKFKDDFLAVQLYYYQDGVSTPQWSKRFEIDENNNVTALDDADHGESFNFYSYFKPDDGLDEIAIGFVDDDLTMDASAASPTNLSFLPGLGRMRVQWMVPSNESIIASVVKYQRLTDGDMNDVSDSPVYIQYGDNSLLEGTTYLSNTQTYLKAVFSETDESAKLFTYTGDILINNRNERYVSGDYANPSGDRDDTEGGDYYANRTATHLAAGYYEVTIYNLKDNGAISVPTEDDDTIQTIHVYDNDTFVRPVLSGVPIRDVLGVVRFDFDEMLTWNNSSSACTSITIYYAKTGEKYPNGTGIKTETIEYFEETGISDAQIGEQFTYSALFEPSGSSFDPVVIAATAPDDNSFIPDVAPSAPMSVTTVAGTKELASDYSGYDTQIPTINVTWTPGSDTADVEAYKVYWYSGDTNATTYTTEYLQLEDITSSGVAASNGITAEYTLVDSEKVDEHGNRTYTQFTYTIAANLDANKKYSVEVSAATEAIEGLAGRTESERTAVVLKPTTYGYDSYKEEVLTYSVVKNNGEEATLMWNNLHEDIAGVAVYYNRAGLTTRYPSTGYEAITTAAPYTSLSTAYVGSSFTYIAYYVPNGSTETVKVKWDDEAATQVGTIPDPVPVPSGLSFTTSYAEVTETSDDDDATQTIVGYTASINVSWNLLVDTEKIVDRMYVRCYDEYGAYTDVRVALDRESYPMDGLEVGTTYSFQIVTEDTDTQDADGNNLTSESEMVTVKTYSPWIYTTADLPIATATIVEQDGNTENIEITWSNLNEDLVALYLTYDGKYVNESCDAVVGAGLGYPETEYIPYTLTDLAKVITIENTVDTEFTYHAYFAPTGATENIKVEGGRGLATPETDSPYYIDSETGNYMVCTGEGLKTIASMINMSSSYRAINIELAYSIDLSTSVCGPSIGSWTPIGSSSSIAFTGTFNGNGKSINGLYFDKTSGANYLGLFGNVSGATIQNVKLIAPTIISTAGGPTHIGTIAGNASANTTIENCTVTEGAYSISNANGTSAWGVTSYVGGLVGRLAGSSVVDSCNVDVDMSVEGLGRVGGVVGQIYGNTVYIANCHSTGDIRRADENEATSRICYVGGIAGEVEDKTSNVFIIGCSNAGNFTGWSNLGGIVGRFVAYSGGIFASYNTGNISALDFRIGGIAGSIAATTDQVAYGSNSLYSAASDGTINYQDDNAIDSADLDFAEYQATVVGCINTGSLYTIYTGSPYIGGLIGGDFATNVSTMFTTSGWEFKSYTQYSYNYFMLNEPEVTVINSVKWAIGRASLDLTNTTGATSYENDDQLDYLGIDSDTTKGELNGKVDAINTKLGTEYTRCNVDANYKYKFSAGGTGELPSIVPYAAE